MSAKNKRHHAEILKHQAADAEKPMSKRFLAKRYFNSMNRFFKVFALALVTCGVLMSAAPVPNRNAANESTVQADLQAVRNQLVSQAQ
ncbi:hypothetical protein [Rhodoflexus sp.]